MKYIFKTNSQYFADKHHEIRNEENNIIEIASTLKVIQMHHVQRLSDVLEQVKEKKRKYRKIRLRL